MHTGNHRYNMLLQCYDTVAWASGTASGLEKMSDGVLLWLSVYSEVQIVSRTVYLVSIANS